MHAISKVIISAVAAMCALTASAQATTWPARPIRIVVPYSAGGAGDIVARTVGDAIAKSLKQAVVIENKAGASGMLGAAACKASAPDGHTFCLFLMDVVTTNPVIFKKVPYNADTDFMPVALVAEPVAVLPVPASLPVTTMRDLAALAASNPQGTNWGSYGMGTASHLVLELVNKQFRSAITHVPYKDTSTLITSVLNGEVSTTVAAYAQVKQHIAQKKMRALAVLGPKRLRELPEVPTLAEQGVDFQAAFWYGMFAPAGTPADAVRQMNDAVNKSFADPAVAKFFDVAAISTRQMSTADFASLVKRDTELWRGIALRANISLD